MTSASREQCRRLQQSLWCHYSLFLLRTPQQWLTMLSSGLDNPKIAHSLRGIWTQSNTWFLGPTRVTNPNDILIGSAVLLGSRTWPHDINIDHATPSVVINRPHLAIAAMRPKNEKCHNYHTKFQTCNLHACTFSRIYVRTVTQWRIQRGGGGRAAAPPPYWLVIFRALLNICCSSCCVVGSVIFQAA